MIQRPPISWLHGGEKTDFMAPILVGFRILATTWLTKVSFVPLWRGGTRRLRASTFLLGRWHWHLIMCHVCCVSPLMACFCPTRPYHGTRWWNGWRRTWGLIRVKLLLRWRRPKVHIADLATCRWFSSSIWRSSWSWRLSMVVWLRRWGGCGSRLSAYIYYTWWGNTIFIDKSQNDVDVVYLRYFRDLDLVAGYLWGAAALAHLYRELNNVARWNYGQVAGYLTLLQV